jgi:hypothetical protein
VSWSSVKVRREMWGGGGGVEQGREMKRGRPNYLLVPKIVGGFSAWYIR